MKKSIVWPNNKRFAFTIFDDTDLTTLENGRTVYSFLYEHGFRTTKSVWPIKGTQEPRIGGTTCEDLDYAKWACQLQDQGFEIALHNATYHTASRAETIRGFDRFRQLFGKDPTSFANHSGCKEVIYWEDQRLTPPFRWVYHILTRFRRMGGSKGHVEGSDLFWGDICQKRVKYVRNFVYRNANTFAEVPFMPYHDATKPFVKYWFAASEGPVLSSFLDLLSEANLDKLEREGGACIVYTHFGTDFVTDGKLDHRFKSIMSHLSKKDGWFVPVTTLLDYLLEKQGPHEITRAERWRLERKWLLDKVITGGTT